MTSARRQSATIAKESVFSLPDRESEVLFSAVQITDGLPLSGTFRLARGLKEGLGLSLSYAGLANDKAMKSLRLHDDTYDDATENPEVENPTRRIHLENEENGLRLTVDYSYYPQHQALLIGGELENISDKPIRHVTELRSFDLAFDLSEIGDPKVHTIGGGVTHGYFPPVAFQQDSRDFIGKTSFKHPFRIDSGGTGRSSDKHMPFFFIEDERGESGLYGGLEWSSLWHIDFDRQKETFFIRGGVEDIDLTLRPGERIPIPRALLGFYEGSLDGGKNALRRFIHEWFPLYQGEDLGAPVIWNHAFTFGATINDEIFRRQVPVCAELGVEWMQIDWGWFTGCIPPRGTYEGIGNWTQVDSERFPNGIEPLADLVRSHGMKYCTWFDPEEAHPSSLLAKEHPEWLLYIEEKEMGLVNFGLREVQEWFLEVIQKRIDEWGIHKLKWDHNIDPKPYWDAHEDPEHRGLMQIKHVRGVYRVWEELTRRNPQLILENCSSGGRRFDLGTFRRAHIHHGSDFNFQDDIVRNQISGVNTVMPTHRVIHTCTWGGPDFPDTYIQSRFGGILRFSQDFASWPDHALERVKRHIAVYKSVRHLLKEDFYALFPQPRTLEDWDGWQFHDPQSGEGFVMAFRMSGPDAQRSPRWHELSPDASYVLKDPYTDEEHEQTGQHLMQQGWSFTLEPNTAGILHYRPKERP